MHDKHDSITIHGMLIDDNTRCEHYHSDLDVIAIRFKCCNEYYACYQCHQEKAGHKAETWKKTEWNTQAIYCGYCKNEMTIEQYINSGNHCPFCNGEFNPKCSNHYYLYFEI